MPKLRSVLALVFLVVSIAGGSVTYAMSPAMQQPQPATISVSGVIVYDTGSAIVPAEGLMVKLIDYDTVSRGPGETLGKTTTDSFGRYSFEDIPNNDIDGPERRRAGGQDVQLLILTDNDRVAVQRYPQASPYSWASVDRDLLDARGRVIDVPDGEHVAFPTIQFDDDVRDFQAVRAFVALNEGWSFLADQTGLGVTELGKTVARWPVLSMSERGYDPDTRLIMLGPGDADSADAVIHLQAHAFMDTALRNLGSQYPADCATEERIDVATTQTCAYFHGWGVFFAVAAQNDPAYVTATEALNIEAPLVNLEDGDAVAARVAGALWDLMDATNEGFDRYTGSFLDLWNTVANAAVFTFREFWDASGLPACEALPSLFQNTINYNTPPQLDPFPDPIEMDEDPDPPPSFDMRARARDAECPFEALLFDIQGPATSTVTVELRDDGFLEIIPAPNWYGEVTANVRVFDGVEFVSQPVHIVVHSVNDPPEIAALPDRSAKVGEPIVYQLENSISDVDHAKSELTLSIPTDPETLVPRLEWDIDQENFIVRFLPRLANGDVDMRPGLNAVEIVVTDPEGASARKTLGLEWVPLPNEAPTIDPAIPLVWQAHQGQTIEMNLLPYATDDKNDPSELKWFVQAGTLENATVAGAGTQNLVFTPDPASFIGDDQITLIVKDLDGAEATVDVILRWTELPNIAPTINPPIPDFRTGINQQLVVDLSRYGHDADDNDGSLRWYVQFTDPEAPNPFVTGQGTQRLTFRPVVDFEGTISVRLVVRDPRGAEASQVVHLTWENFNTYMPILMRPFPQKPTN